MILDIAPSEIISEDTIFTVESSDAEIEAWIEQVIKEYGMTREELEAELEAYAAELTYYYVPADVTVIPEENPCIIMYVFKAPLTGDYEFTVGELLFGFEEEESDEAEDAVDVVVNANPQTPFEFRIYSTEAAHSVSDGEEIELSARDIIAIQRILLDFATEFNANGLPTNFESDESYVDESEVKTSDAVLINGRWVMLTRRQIRERQREQEQQERKANYATVDSIINNVPYDDVFAQGAGFHAHTGLRAVTNIIDDSSFRKNVIQDFLMPTPETGSAIKLNENFSVNVIATQEEHDRTQELDAMSNFALLREALGYTQRQDYARLGSDHTKIISARYELIEDKPRMPDPKSFRVYDEGIQDIKEEGVNFFLDEYGDYFVAGYTWGNRYDATIEILTEPGKSILLSGIKIQFWRFYYPCFLS